MPTANTTALDQDLLISEAVERDGSRLRNFIRRHVNDRDDADDILQEVFYELIESYRLMKPIEQVSAWLFRVARNRITDRFRKRKPVSLSDVAASATDGEGDALLLEELLPSPDAGPDALYARRLLLEELDEALNELPDDQRAVFVEHEIEGRSFKEIAEETGVNLNTLLSRKRYAVLYLRERLHSIYNEFSNG